MRNLYFSLFLFQIFVCQHSVFTGSSPSAIHLGGSVGIGYEFKFHDFALSTSYGTLNLTNRFNLKGLDSPYGFDVGFKYFIIDSTFISLNYGLSAFAYTETTVYNNPTIRTFEKFFSFSISIGKKYNLYQEFSYCPFLGFDLNTRREQFTNFRWGILLFYRIDSEH